MILTYPVIIWKVQSDTDEILAPAKMAEGFVLHAQEHVKIAQTALDVDSTKALLAKYLDVVKISLSAKLKDSIGHNFEFFPGTWMIYLCWMMFLIILLGKLQLSGKTFW